MLVAPAFPLPPQPPAQSTRPATNDGTIRASIWRRYAGDDWAAFDQLPAAIRHRLAEHAYDAWSVNALMLWRHYRSQHPTPERAQRALLRYFDYCERLERSAFAAQYAQHHSAVLPHVAANITVLRYQASPASPGIPLQPGFKSPRTS